MGWTLINKINEINYDLKKISEMDYGLKELRLNVINP